MKNKENFYSIENVNESIKRSQLVDKSGKMNKEDLKKLNELLLEILFCGEVFLDKLD